MDEAIREYQDRIASVIRDLNEMNIGIARAKLESIRHDLKRLKTISPS